MGAQNNPRTIDRTPATWRGVSVPPALAVWFDQMVSHPSLARHLDLASADSYIDVTLTMAPGGNYAKPPIFQIK